jgi:hypothetical protein
VRGIVKPIYTLADAQAAVDLIVEQGEGTTTSPLAGMGSQLAHYYRFAEIFHQRTLVPDDSVPEKYSYSGAPIPYDPTGVLPIIANPNSGLYPAKSTERVESDVRRERPTYPGWRQSRSHQRSSDRVRLRLRQPTNPGQSE